MASWEEKVRKVVPYTPGEQPKRLDIVKLNTNENPYPPSEKVIEAIRGVSMESLRRYPDPAAQALTDAIAAFHGLRQDQVFVGVGSDDVLAMSFLTFFTSGKPVLFPDITYSFYEVWADLFRIPTVIKPLDDRLCLRKEDYLPAKNPDGAGGIIFPNPNAPTGVLMPLSDIEKIIGENPGCVVIVDEAYIDFADDAEKASALNLLSRYENLLVVRTLSKSRALAGMRIGYAVGSPKMIRYLNDCKYSFNSYTMNQTTIAAGKAAMEDAEWFRVHTDMVRKTRERSKRELEELGFHFADSQANFLFVQHESVPARQLFHDLREEGIIVRYFDKPRTDNYLRITIGTDGEMDRLFAFLRGYLKR